MFFKREIRVMFKKDDEKKIYIKEKARVANSK